MNYFVFPIALAERDPEEKTLWGWVASQNFETYGTGEARLVSGRAREHGG